MSSRCSQAFTTWILLNAVYFKIAGALILAVGTASIVCGIVLCRGNTVQIIKGESIQGIYEQMGIPMIIFGGFIELFGLAIVCVVHVITRKYEPIYWTFYKRPELGP
uniref:Tetraspanin n=1 Tax=Mesocestoides corti TaxID=53468 RepID=A0A5K3FDW6_MESCO